MTAWIAVLAAGLAYTGLLAWNMGAWAGGSDTSGYLNEAKLLRQGRFHLPQRQLAGVKGKLPVYGYVPLGFRPVDGNRMVPTYPVGLPLLIVATSFLTGWDAASHVTLGLHAIAGVLLMFALARKAGLSRRSSLLGALLLALSPLYLMMSTEAMSDMPALVWCTAAVLCAWQSRERAPWALAAGFAVGMAVLLRPTDLLILLPVALLLGRGGRRWIWLVAGGAPAALFQALLNYSLYGKVLTSGYGDVERLFSWAFVPPVLANYARSLPIILTPAVVLAFALPWAGWRQARRTTAVLVAWIVAILGFYAFYYHTQETWWYLRFILPAFPPLIVAMLLVGRALAVRGSIRRLGFVAALAAIVVLGWDRFWIRKWGALNAGRDERGYYEFAQWTDQHLPPHAVLACMQTSGAVLYYTDLTFVRWDWLGARGFAKIEKACAETHRPLYAALYPFELKQALEDAMPGNWTQVGTVKQVTIFRWDGK